MAATMAMASTRIAFSGSMKNAVIAVIAVTRRLKWRPDAKNR